MDIANIDDVQQLKAIAYDQMLMLDQLQRNLAVINARIAELQVPGAPSTLQHPAAKKSQPGTS